MTTELPNDALPTVEVSTTEISAAADSTLEIAKLEDPKPEISATQVEEETAEVGTPEVPTPEIPTLEVPKSEARGEAPEVEEEPTESFADLLKDFEKSHSHRVKAGPGAAGDTAAQSRQLEGTVVSVTADQVFLDIGYKTEGVLPRTAFERNGDGVKVGDAFGVSVTGRNAEGYYELSRFKVAQVRDWSAIEAAFADKTAVVGTVTEVRKGGASVDIGVKAFMPASRSGTKDAAELEKLVGTEITCRITKLDVTDEDVVVDRRVVLEEQARGLMANKFAEMKEGETVTGTVRTLVPFGAFVDLGGVDGLLHVSEMAHSRVAKPEDVVTVGQQVTVRILKIDPATKNISLVLKQLQPEPWTTAPDRLKVGERVKGVVTRIMEFGAFVEIEPGVEGLIHISEMSWGKKVRHPSDVVKPGDMVDAEILSIKPEERRIALGLKHALSNPWAEAEKKFPVGSQVEGPVTRIMAFGAFVEVAEGVEGMVHVSEIVADRRINHPSDVLRAGQRVQAQVLAVDAVKRQIKLSMKQLIPTSIDEYIAEHKVGDVVSGRVVEVNGASAVAELGEGIRAACGVAAAPSTSTGQAEVQAPGKVDLGALSSMLKSKWKGNGPASEVKVEALAAGQVRSFKIVKLDAEGKKIGVEVA
jgi:small subunit ribosomal protein S1